MVAQSNRRSEFCVIYFLIWQLNYVLNLPLNELVGNSETLIGPASSSVILIAPGDRNANNNNSSSSKTELRNATEAQASVPKSLSPEFLNTASDVGTLRRKQSTLIPPDTVAVARGCPACTEPDCGNPVYKWIWDFRAIAKTFVGLAIGTVVFFALFFFYKLLSYPDDHDYVLSTYYGSGGKKPFIKRNSNSGHPLWDSALSALTSVVFNALETSY